MWNSLRDISLDSKEDVLFNKLERGSGIFIHINEKVYIEYQKYLNLII